MYKPLALCLLLIATPVVAATDLPATAETSQQTATASASAEQPAAQPLPVVPAAELAQAPDAGWADRAASMISIFAGVTTVLLLIWKTISNRVRVRREQGAQQP